MKGSFRKSMAWLHTWSGLVVIWLLFAVFVTGTLSFYRTEITHWMQPEGHIGEKVDRLSSANIAWDKLEQLAPWVNSWSIILPSERNPKTGLAWVAQGEQQRRRGPRALMDSGSGEILDLRETAGGDFLYDFHFELYAVPRDVGRAVIGFASMLMLVAIISGVIIHRKIFANFFTFRPGKRTVSWIDGHVVGSVLALPFHIMITFSGLVLLSSTLLFWNDGGGRSGGARTAGETAMHPDGHGGDRLRMDAIRPDINAIFSHAQAQFQGPVAYLNIQNPMTPDAVIQVTGATRESLFGGRSGPQLSYDIKGDPLPEQPPRQTLGSSLPLSIFVVLKMSHEARFADVLTRILFFIAGVLGSAMVATGAILWAVKRAKQQVGRLGYKLVCTLNVASITGLMVALGAYFWSNRLLPADIESRDVWEIRVFFLVWLLTLIHAAFARKHYGWMTQSAVASALFLLIPVLDTLTSPVGLWTAIQVGDWPRVGFDIVSVLTGLTFAGVVFWIRNQGRAKSKHPYVRPVTGVRAARTAESGVSS